MTANDVLIDGFSRVQGSMHKLLDGLTDDQLTWRPADDANTIAWLAWHIARGQDAQIASLAGMEQVWTTGGWYDKFGLPFDQAATGYAQTSEEVGQVKVSAELLLGYYDATHKQTVEYLIALNNADFTDVVDTSYDPPVTRAVRLVSILDDNLEHIGQIGYVKGLQK